MTRDIGETVDCPNCGHPNPAWAQVCRNCGISLQRELGRPITRPTTPFPTDQASLVSVGAAVGSIVLAILLGLFFSAINPTQPTVGLSTSTSTPSPTPVASPSVAATTTPKPTPTPIPKPPGTITFGTGLNRTTHKVTNPTDSFVPHELLAYSVTVPQPFGVSSLAVEVSKVVNGKETVVDPRASNPITVNPNLKIFGVAVQTDALLRAYGGGGVFMLRVYKGSQKLAEGKFTLSSG